MNRHFRSQVRLSCDGKLTRNRANSNFHPQPAIVILAPIWISWLREHVCSKGIRLQARLLAGVNLQVIGISGLSTKDTMDNIDPKLASTTHRLATIEHSDRLGDLVPQVRARTSPGVFRDMTLLGLCLELSFSVLYCRTQANLPTLEHLIGALGAATETNLLQMLFQRRFLLGQQETNLT